MAKITLKRNHEMISISCPGEPLSFLLLIYLVLQTLPVLIYCLMNGEPVREMFLVTTCVPGSLTWCPV
jgi:hypothetical protein